MSKVIGIDLGTTNSVVAVMEGGDPVVISTAEGSRLLPSVVAVNKNGERIIGQAAKRQAVVNPENTIYSVKRFMGRSYDEVEQERRMVPYHVERGPSGDARIRLPVNNRVFTPQEVSAMILGKLKADAEAYLGEPVTKAVITVPAYFNDSQRQATKDAGRIAGLDVQRIINEPTASALAYGLDKKTNEKILVFDLGGGTFDVSVLEVGEGIFEVKATNGDTHLGGDDWDEVIVNWAADTFQKEQGVDLRKDRQALQRLREAAEKAKIELSSMLETEFNLPYITADAAGPKHLQMRLNRANFERLTSHLLDRCRTPFDAVLKDAGLDARAIDEVVLVGGSTRMPMVVELVQKLTGKEPNKSVNPDEVVAMGAAIQAAVLTGEVKDVLLLDVTPLSLGVETLGSVMTHLIERNTTIPVKKTEIFSTAEDNQPGVDIHVLQGERAMSADNISLGHFRLDGIAPAARGLPQIEVTFDIDANGILNVSAVDKATGRQQQVTIQASTNLNKAEVEKLVQGARQNQAEDSQRRELVEARNTAEAIIYEGEKALKSQNGKINPNAHAEVGRKITELRSAFTEKDVTHIRALTDELKRMLESILVQAQANPQSQPQASPYAGSQEPEAGSGPEDVIEGEYQQA
jgi:molecular chaperone DnaK